jgi:hypothetical protein
MAKEESKATARSPSRRRMINNKNDDHQNYDDAVNNTLQIRLVHIFFSFLLLMSAIVGRWFIVGCYFLGYWHNNINIIIINILLLLDTSEVVEMMMFFVLKEILLAIQTHFSCDLNRMNHFINFQRWGYWLMDR